MSDEEERADVDAHIMKLAETFLPVDEASDSDLRQLVTYSRWFSNKEIGDRIANEAKREILLRAQRKAEAPAFRYGDKVRVTEDIKWWPTASAAKPMSGIEGVVMAARMRDADRWLGGRAEPTDYEGLIPTRFLSTDVGYEWDEEDDPDRKYVTYNMPNYVLEKIT